MRRLSVGISFLFLIGIFAGAAKSARADGDLQKVNHIIVMMQENHSFDNYFGVLPYSGGGPYHPPKGKTCVPSDHECVDALTCDFDANKQLKCRNNNVDDDGSTVFSFHETKFCTGPDLDHEWPGSHSEANLKNPTETLLNSPNDGFVVQNDATEQIDNGVENPTEDDTIGYYNQDDLPFYYNLAQTFAIDDNYFSSLLGPTFSNRCYSYAATSFGHLDAQESIFPGFKPITGTILDLLDEEHVTWGNYFSDVPVSFSFRPLSPNAVPIENFLDAAKKGKLPEVSFVDPNFGILITAAASDEHPPSDIRSGEFFISKMVNAVRKGPNWKDSVIFITYDEAGGFYDHVAPPRARQEGKPNPDGINPGQCADLSDPPASERPGGGVACVLSQGRAKALCPTFTPTGPYPKNCPTFNQYGFRVPFIAFSPFSKPQYVSHTLGDHGQFWRSSKSAFFTATASI